MRPRALLLLPLCLLAASPAMAVVKAYNGDLAPGAFILTADTLSPPAQTTPGRYTGSYVLEDTSSGTVTLSRFGRVADTFVGVDTTGAFGPGSFVFVEVRSTLATTPNQLGTGSTAPGGDVAWGILFGFSATGFAFCEASPTSICTNGGFSHSRTIPSGIASPTYDIGTWSFDAEGDFEATPYIESTGAGGTSNTRIVLRGAFQGASIPALPLVSFGALAVALLAAGTRAALRRR